MYGAKLITLEGDRNSKLFSYYKNNLQKLKRKANARVFEENTNLYSGYDLGFDNLLGKGVDWAKLRAGLRKGIGFAANVFVPGSGSIIEKTLETADKNGIGPKLSMKLAKKNITNLINKKLSQATERQKTAIAVGKAAYDSAISSGKQVFEAIADSKKGMQSTLDQIPENKMTIKKVMPFALAGIGAIILFSRVKK